MRATIRLEQTKKVPEKKGIDLLTWGRERLKMPQKNAVVPSHARMKTLSESVVPQKKAARGPTRKGPSRGISAGKNQKKRNTTVYKQMFR